MYPRLCVRFFVCVCSRVLCMYLCNHGWKAMGGWEARKIRGGKPLQVRRSDDKWSLAGKQSLCRHIRAGNPTTRTHTAKTTGTKTYLGPARKMSSGCLLKVLRGKLVASGCFRCGFCQAPSLQPRFMNRTTRSSCGFRQPDEPQSMNFSKPVL